MTTNAQIALAELLRRRANAAALLRQGRMPRADAEAAIARWCGIAAWFGAVLPDDLRPYGQIQLWTDHAPKDMSAREWLTEFANQLRRDTKAALDRYEANGKTEQGQPLAQRALALLRLDRQLSIAAGIGPIHPEPERKAA